MTLKPLFQNTFILCRPREAIFAEIIKIATMFIKTIFKGATKLYFMNFCRVFIILFSTGL